MTTRLEGQQTRFLPFNLGHNLGAGQPAEPERPQDLVPVGAGLGAGRVAGHPAPVHRRAAPEEGNGGAEAAGAAGDLPALPPVGRGAEARGRRARATAPGRSYLIQHSAGSGSRTRSRGPRTGSRRLHDAGRPEGVRQGGRDHRPGRARPAAAGHDLPVRARARGGREDRRELPAARRRAGRRAGADHHHDAAEVPVRARQGRRPARRAATR